MGIGRVKAGYNDQFQPLTPREGLQELKDFLEHLEITTDKTIFRFHASNYLI
jgi:hypothetical protein